MSMDRGKFFKSSYPNFDQILPDGNNKHGQQNNVFCLELPVSQKHFSFHDSQNDLLCLLFNTREYNFGWGFFHIFY
jgi:hypothetical protein